MNTKFAATLLLLGSSLVLSAPAFSIPLSTVGSIDTLLYQTNISPSSTGAEINWIESKLGIDIDPSTYTQTDVIETDWTAVDGLLGVFAIELSDPLDWFLIKIGNNSGSPSTHFLFDNISNLDYAVVNLVAMGFSSRNTLNIGKISHIGSASSSTAIPEPASLALMGMGLLAAGLVRRRRKT